MIKNPKERKNFREANRYVGVKPLNQMPQLNCSVKFSDVPFPPLLKYQSKKLEHDEEPNSHTKSFSPTIARKNTIYQVKANDNINNTTLEKILKERRSVGRWSANEEWLQMEESLKFRASNLFYSKKRHILNKMGQSLKSTKTKTLQNNKTKIRYNDEMQECLLDPKQLTVHKKFIETTMNSISYERDRMRQAIQRDKERFYSRKSEPSHTTFHRPSNSTILNREENNFLNESRHNNTNSPRRRASELERYMPQSQQPIVDLRPWTNNLADQQ